MESQSFVIDTFTCIIYFCTQMPKFVCIGIHTSIFMYMHMFFTPQSSRRVFILHSKYEH